MVSEDLSHSDVQFGRASRLSGAFRMRDGLVPKGDQESAIRQLVQGLNENRRDQVLLGVTGSGKTYTMAKMIEAVNRPALVLAHNKTLAAQLYQEFKTFFPENAVEYFVSYYDYYQPEAYMPATDTYIEKEVLINDEIDRLRHSATRSLFERRDCIVVASVSCIYGLGSPEAYYGMLLFLETGQKWERRDLLRRLVDIQYERNDHNFIRGTFRVRGDTIEVFPTYEELGVRIELFGNEIEQLAQIDPLSGTTIKKHDRIPVYPKSHYVIPAGRWQAAIQSMRVCSAEARQRGDLQALADMDSYLAETLLELGEWEEAGRAAVEAIELGDRRV